MKVRYNDSIVESDKALWSSDARVHRYGDGLFESIAMIRGKLPLIHEHYERLQTGANILKLDWPAHLSECHLIDYLEELAVLNRAGDNLRFRVSLMRSSKGKYLPESNQTDLLISATVLSASAYPWKKIGSLHVYRKNLKPIQEIGKIKSNNALLYVIASLEAKECGADDALILNTHRKVCEGSSSNVVIEVGKSLFTPADDEGCVLGVGRRFLLEHFDVKAKPIEEEELELAEEIFLISASSGIRSLDQWNGRSLQTGSAQDICKTMNEMWGLA